MPRFDESPDTIYRGVVARWITWNGSPHGYLYLYEGPDLPFDNRGAMIPIVENNSVRWAFPDETDDRGNQLQLPELPTPQEGDIILFKPYLTRRGKWVVDQWTFESLQDQAEAELDARPLYRLMSQNPFTRVGVDNPPKLVWEGQEPSQASLVSMSPTDQQESGYRQWWLRKDGDQWVRCDDPRSNPIYLYRSPIARVSW